MLDMTWQVRLLLEYLLKVDMARLPSHQMYSYLAASSFRAFICFRLV